MNILLKDTGLIYSDMIDVVSFLKKYNLKTISDLISYNIDALETKDLGLKNQLRGLRDLLLFRYSGELLPTEYYLSLDIKLEEDIDHKIIVSTGDVNFRRMGFSKKEEDELISWAKILYSQYAKSSITVIDLFETYLNFNKNSEIALKLKTYLDYHYNYNYQLSTNINSIDDLKNLYSRMVFLRKRKQELDHLRKISNIKGWVRR